MPAGRLHQLLSDFTAVDHKDNDEHNPSGYPLLTPGIEYSSFRKPFSWHLGRTSFLDASIPLEVAPRRRMFSAFTHDQAGVLVRSPASSADKLAAANLEAANDKLAAAKLEAANAKTVQIKADQLEALNSIAKSEDEVMNTLSQKVDDALHKLEMRTDKKVAEFEKTMEDAVQASLPKKSGGQGGQGFGPSATVHLPDLPANKRAVIEIAPPLEAGESPGAESDGQIQQAILGKYAKRLESLTNGLTETDKAPPVEPPQPQSGTAVKTGSLGSLYKNLKDIEGHLQRGGAVRKHPPKLTPEPRTDDQDQEDIDDDDGLEDEDENHLVSL